MNKVAGMAGSSALVNQPSYVDQSSKMQQDQTMAWAQQNYFMDSGINTGVPTATSLISGLSGVSSMIEDYDAYTPAFTQDQVNGYNIDYENSRSMRVRAAMFPETIVDPNSVPGANGAMFDFGQSSNVHRLTESGQMLKTAVVNIINYQDDAERTLKAIPELIKLLSDEDTVVAGQAAKFIHHISKVEAMSRVLASHPNMIDAVLSLINSNQTGPETTKHMVGTLYNVSGHSNGLMAIFRSGGIEALVKLLESPIDSVIYYAITTLHNLTLHQKGAKEAIRRADGVPRMVNLLKTKSLAKFLAIVVDCLYNLALTNQETKFAILAHGGPVELVRILKSFDYEKLLWTTSRLIQALSVCPENKKAIIAAGGLLALTPRLAHPSQRLVQTILWGLRNLSDSAAALQDENVEPLLVGLLQLLGSSDSKVVLCCVCILSNLSCNNIRSKATICRNGGVKFLLRTLETFMMSPHLQPAEITDLLEPTLCTLRHITIRHPDAEIAQNEVRLYNTGSVPSKNGLQLIAEFAMVNHQGVAQVPLKLVKPALGVIRNVANLAANAQLLSSYGVALHICAHLTHSYQVAQQAQRCQNAPPLIDDVKCLEMVETCVTALHILCKNPDSRLCAIQANVVPVLVQLLYYDIETIQCYAAGTLAELVNEKEGAKQVEQYGATAQLTELLHSRNENISTYSASVIHTLSMTKPIEYRERLDMELTSSLVRDDSTPWCHDNMNDMPQVNEDSFDLYNAGYGHPATNYDMAMDGPATPHYSTMDTSGMEYHQHQQQQQQHQHQIPPRFQAQNMPAPNQRAGTGLADWYDTNL